MDKWKMWKVVRWEATRRVGVVLALVVTLLIPGSSAHAQAGLCAFDDPTDPDQMALWEEVMAEVQPAKTLMITDLGVVNDRGRTYEGCGGTGSAANTPVGTAGGKWTFGNVMRKLAGSQNVPDFTMNWLKTWQGGTSGCLTVNGFTLGVRPGIKSVIDSWPKTPDGKLDVDKAPFRLLAIVNRMDLASGGSYGNAGEGRLVFGWYDPRTSSSCNTVKQFTVIFEFKLPKSFNSNTTTNTLIWSQKWLELATLPIGSADYNTKLQSLTDLFITQANLGQVRTNELTLGGGSTSGLTCTTISNPSSWELREFKLSSGKLLPSVTALTPHSSKDNTTDLVNWLNTNTGALLAGTASPPATWLGGAIRAANDPSVAWAINVAEQIDDLEARHQFGVQTCNGCHTNETATCFTHVMPRPASAASGLSRFLTGQSSDLSVFDLSFTDDPVAGELLPLSFNELDCRALDLYDIIHGTQSGQRSSSPGDLITLPTDDPAEALMRRIPRNRVH